MKKRHKAEQMIRIIREVDAAPTVAQGARCQGISEQTYYRWKKKYGGMTVEQGKRLKEVEQENARLKKIVADQTLIIDGLREINRKNW
jgi:putative transposase